MSIPLNILLQRAEVLWPANGAEAWDAPGLVTGNSSQPIARVLLTVDVTTDIVNEAIDGGFDLVFAHHPIVMKGVSSLSEQTAKGSLLAKAIRSNLAIFAAHTNADIVENGVSDTIAKKLGLSGIRPLVSSSETEGHGRVGVLPGQIKLGDFARLLAQLLPSTAQGVKVAGNFDQPISKVALCGGAGDSFLPNAIQENADVYVSSDLRHHVVQDIREIHATQGSGPAVIDVSHWASEWLWLEVAAEQLQDTFPGVQFVVSHIRTDPWDFVITQ